MIAALASADSRTLNLGADRASPDLVARGRMNGELTTISRGATCPCSRERAALAVAEGQPATEAHETAIPCVCAPRAGAVWLTEAWMWATQWARARGPLCVVVRTRLPSIKLFVPSSREVPKSDERESLPSGPPHAPPLARAMLAHPLLIPTALRSRVDLLCVVASRHRCFAETSPMICHAQFLGGCSFYS